ncbi:hypothetical protein M5K25_023644 [Dendrobium thyrsiflorum]|uniref:Uncharacterized protein n=1 Tax=Dendrobium thyrsiflorum TaxID=117978 RepID=A0ABD0U8Q1_DENTH
MITIRHWQGSGGGDSMQGNYRQGDGNRQGNCSFINLDMSDSRHCQASNTIGNRRQTIIWYFYLGRSSPDFSVSQNSVISWPSLHYLKLDLGHLQKTRVLIGGNCCARASFLEHKESNHL